MHLPTFLLLLGTVGIFHTSAQEEETAPTPEYAVCRYWCFYNRPYCCDDGSLQLPADHEVHETLDCPPMDQHICKSSGIYLNNTYPALELAKGDPKNLWCASDGYCKEKERCCPSPCVKRHLCMTGLRRENAVEEEEEGELAVEEELLEDETA